MAYCENCGTPGFNSQEMSSDTSLRILLGPCCAQKLKTPEFDLGLEVSLQKGIQAYLIYGDYSLRFRKNPHERQDSNNACGGGVRNSREIERFGDILPR